jgi:hypothetical protein
MIGFITTSVTHALFITITSEQYSAIFHLHRLQFTVANALGFPLFSTSRLRATAFNTHYNSLTLRPLHTSLLFTEALFTIHDSILHLH